MRLKNLCLAIALMSLTTSNTPSTAEVKKGDSPFATEVFSHSGYERVHMYSDPESVLGKPHPLNPESGPCPAGPVSMIEPTFGVDPVTGAYKRIHINRGQEIVVTFDSPIKNDSQNPYGIDFVAFGYSMFTYGGYANIPYTRPIPDRTNIFSYNAVVSVSPDGKNWYVYENGPYVGENFPTQAVKMRPDNTFRDEKGRFWEKNFTKPVNPALKVEDFAGITVYDADGKYGSSAGGTGFDLTESGFDEISYVKFTPLSGWEGRVDAVADVDPDLNELYLIPENGVSLDVEPGDLTLKWKLPPSRGNVTYHLNLYGNNSYSDVSKQVTGKDSLEAIFENLKGNQGYRLYIIADYENLSGDKIRESGLWQFYTKNRAPRITTMTPGDGNTVPVDGELRFEAKDPDEDKLEVSVLIWSGDIKGEVSPDWIYTERPSKDPKSSKPIWRIGLSEDFYVEPNTTYTWQVRVSDGCGGSEESQRLTFRTDPVGYSRKTIDGKVTGDIELLPFHAVDIVPQTEGTALKDRTSFDIVLLEEPQSTDVGSRDSSSLGVDFTASADMVLAKAVAFDLTLSGDANSAILPMTMTFQEKDLKALSVDLSTLTKDNFLEAVRPVKISAGRLFDLVKVAGSMRDQIFNVSKPVSSENNYTVEFPILLIDSDSGDVKAIFTGYRSYLAIWDGKKDGKLSDPITAMTPKKVVPPSPSSDDGGSSGCNLSHTPIALVLLIPLLGMMKK